MIADALKYLAELVSRGNAPVRMDVPDPRNAYFAMGGEWFDINLPYPPRDHRPGSLDDLIALAGRFAEGDAAVGMPIAWYGPDRVVLVVDDDFHRIERATLGLDRSDAFRALAALRDERPWFEPKPFVRLLRVGLAGTLAPGELLERVRSVRFENGAVTTAENARTRESLGREIRSKVDASGEIPEEVTLSVPVYRTPGEAERYPCRCAVEVDPAMGRFQLLPLPDEIERVVGLAVASIGARLRAGLPESVPCYLGSP